MDNALEHLMEKNLSDVFGQRDPARREAAIGQIFAEDCTFFEAQGPPSVGRAALSARAQRILEENPGFVFRAAGPAQVIQDLGRLPWQFGPPEAPPVVTGVDIVVFQQGRIGALFTFLVRAPRV